MNFAFTHCQVLTPSFKRSLVYSDSDSLSGSSPQKSGALRRVLKQVTCRESCGNGDSVTWNIQESQPAKAALGGSVSFRMFINDKVVVGIGSLSISHSTADSRGKDVIMEEFNVSRELIPRVLKQLTALYRNAGCRIMKVPKGVQVCVEANSPGCFEACGFHSEAKSGILQLDFSGSKRPMVAKPSNDVGQVLSKRTIQDGTNMWDIDEIVSGRRGSVTFRVRRNGVPVIDGGGKYDKASFSHSLSGSRGQSVTLDRFQLPKTLRYQGLGPQVLKMLLQLYHDSGCQSIQVPSPTSDAFYSDPLLPVLCSVPLMMAPGRNVW